jgi:hypothetical protein
MMTVDEIKMECYHCKGKRVKSKAPFSIYRHGYPIAWELIPAWVCTPCGAALFEENEINHIQKALQPIDYETSTFTLKPASAL